MAMNTDPHVDPITLEVMRNGLYSIADEMTMTLVRTARSTNIKDRRDCSCGIYLPNGDLIAQSELNTPVHLGTMAGVVQTILEVYDAAQLGPGDVVVMNTPYPAGPGHLNDVAVVSPVYHAGGLVALLANEAHHVDMGGYAAGSMPFGVTEIYQEGLQVPPVKIVQGGVLDENLLRLILQNVRTPFEVRGDLLAQIAANSIGQRRLGELIEKHGLATMQTYMAALMDYAERRMRSGIQAIPDGRYAFEDYLEGDGLNDDLFTIRVAVEITGDTMRIDWTGTSAQVRGPLNCRWPTVAACVAFVLKCVVDPDLPPNAGAYRPVDIVIPDGSLLAAQFPAAVCNANIVTTQRLVDVLLGALLSALPERVTAASAGTMNLLNIGGLDERTGRYFSYVETCAGGQGAMHCQDGMDGVHTNMTNTRNAPVEVIEHTYPLRVERYALVPDSEGAGRWRGGNGVTREFRILSASVMVTVSSDRVQIAPWGAMEGHHGAPSQCRVIHPDGTVRHLGSKVCTYLECADLLMTATPGGGGWGDPYHRDPERVWHDVVEGLVSAERARSVYGVVIDPKTLEVDEAATVQVRAAHTNPSELGAR